VDRFKDEERIFHVEVIVGNVAASLIDYAEANDIDLILIATMDVPELRAGSGEASPTGSSVLQIFRF